VIKYLGSKRRLVPVLGSLLRACRASTALDLFTGTTRVASEFKRRGAHVYTVDTARYSEVLARCYIGTDARAVDQTELREALRYLGSLPGHHGYFTETFCIKSRYLQPFNGKRVDAIRDAIAGEFRSSPLYPILLTSLLEATDRVDSTTGVQMAYLKDWAPRSFNRLTLRVPELLPGSGTALRGDAAELARRLPHVHLAYLDPPYNQHRYFTNYHVWETLVAWDAPPHYGVACKRADCRDRTTRSAFNSKRDMRGALAQVVRDVSADALVLSYNDEAWVTLDELVEICSVRGAVGVLAFDSKRYVGAQIGIHNPKGEKVGRVSHLRNIEYLLIAADEATLSRMAGGAIAFRAPYPRHFPDPRL
jgi:adenine-specific DNA-methyltransferase